MPCMGPNAVFRTSLYYNLYAQAQSDCSKADGAFRSKAAKVSFEFCSERRESWRGTSETKLEFNVHQRRLETNSAMSISVPSAQRRLLVFNCTELSTSLTWYKYIPPRCWVSDAQRSAPPGPALSARSAIALDHTTCDLRHRDLRIELRS